MNTTTTPTAEELRFRDRATRRSMKKFIFAREQAGWPKDRIDKAVKRVFYPESQDVAGQTSVANALSCLKVVLNQGGRPVVAVDVDATLAEYNGWKGIAVIGEPLPGAKEFLERLSGVADVLIYSTRGSADENGSSPEALKAVLQNWLDSYGMPYKDIWVGRGKPHASAYVDDRNVSCRPQDDPDAYPKALVGVRRLLTANAFCATGPGGGQDNSCSPKDSGGDGSGRSAEGVFGRIQKEILSEASRVQFRTDEQVSTGGYSDVGSRDYDEIENEMTSDERAEMEERLDGIRMSQIDSMMEDYSPEIDQSNIDRDAGYGGEVADDKVRELADEHKETLSPEAYEDLSNFSSGSREALGAIDEAIEAAGQHESASKMVEELKQYRATADREIEESRQRMEDAERDSYYESLSSGYDSSDDRREYLRDWYENHEDRFQKEATEFAPKVWFKDAAGGYVYRFTTKAGQDYTVHAVEMGLGRSLPGVEGSAYDIQFSQGMGGEYSLTGSGSSHEVFGNVIPAAVAFVQKQNAPLVTFSAAEDYKTNPKTGASDWSQSRKKLYNRIVKTVARAVPDYFAAYSELGGTTSHPTRYYAVARREHKDKVLEKMRQRGDEPTMLVNQRAKVVLLNAYIDPRWFTPEGWRDDMVANEGDNCGTGSGGFQPGNTCAKGGDGQNDRSQSDEQGRRGFDAKQWESKDVPTRVKEWKALSVEERDRLADAPKSVRARQSEHLSRKPRPNSGNLEKDLSARVEQHVDRLHPKAVEKIKSEARDYQDSLRRAGADEGTLRELSMEATDALISQEMESCTRQLGDHGISHISGNIRIGMQVLDALPHGYNDRGEAMLRTAMIFHDTGYLATPSRSFLDEGHPRWSAEHYNANIHPLVEKALGTRASREVEHIIRTHDATDLDWNNDPIASASRVADNASVFHQEKLPPLLNYVPKNVEALKGLASKKLSLDECRSQMRKNIEESNLQPRVKALLSRAADEVSPITPKMDLGILGGKISGVSWNGEGIDLRLRENPQATELNKIGDFGQRQFGKFAETYGVDPKSFRRGLDFTFKNRKGENVLRGVYEQEVSNALHLVNNALCDLTTALVENAFCPTGEGGGQDNSCSSKQRAAERWSVEGGVTNFNVAKPKKLLKGISKLRGDLKGFVSVYTEEEYKKMGGKAYVSEDGKSGFYIKPGGELISVFSTRRRRGDDIMRAAIKMGARKLDCFEDVRTAHLTKLYKRHGFRETSRLQWDDQYAPKQWDYPKRNRPPVVFMARA